MCAWPAYCLQRVTCVLWGHAHASHHGVVVDECGWLVMNTWHAWHQGTPCHTRHAYDVHCTPELAVGCVTGTVWRACPAFHVAATAILDDLFSGLHKLMKRNFGKVYREGSTVTTLHLLRWVELGAFVRWRPPSAMWVGPLIFLWPPLGMSE